MLQCFNCSNLRYTKRRWRGEISGSYYSYECTKCWHMINNFAYPFKDLSFLLLMNDAEVCGYYVPKNYKNHEMLAVDMTHSIETMLSAMEKQNYYNDDDDDDYDE